MGVCFEVRVLQRFWRLLCALGVLVTLAAPAALGPSLSPVLERLGAMHEHVCKCGMTPGKCGCPECDRAEQERLHDRVPGALPVLKGGCNDPAPALQFAALPAAALAPLGVLLPVPRGERMRLSPVAAAPSSRDADPPTPPPRLAPV